MISFWSKLILFYFIIALHCTAGGKSLSPPCSGCIIYCLVVIESFRLSVAAQESGISVTRQERWTSLWTLISSLGTVGHLFLTVPQTLYPLRAALRGIRGVCAHAQWNGRNAALVPQESLDNDQRWCMQVESRDCRSVSGQNERQRESMKDREEGELHTECG